MDVEYIAGFGPVVTDSSASQAFWADAFGIVFDEVGPDYFHARDLGGARTFALWPLSQAAESTFGTSAWPADRVVPQAWLELEVAKPEAVGEAVAELRGRGLEVVAEAKVEPWGQTTARLLSPEGLLVGVSYLPSFHETDDAGPSAPPSTGTATGGATGGATGAATDETTDTTSTPTRSTLDLDTARRWLEVAVAQAREGEAEGGVPIGAALFSASGELLGSGRNRRVQDDDPSVHGETDAFRRAGRQASYAGTTMVTTLSPCWYCSGLVRQFGISRVVVGEARTFSGGHEWLAEHGVEVVVLDDPGCVAMMADFVHRHPDVWNEDIGEGADGG